MEQEVLDFMVLWWFNILLELSNILQIHKAVPNNNNPKKYFKYIIHFPGFGKNLII